MNQKPENMEEVLCQQISGFHQYHLTPTVRLCYVSRNLCAMLGVAPEALLEAGEDGYARQVHPADQAAYGAFLEALGRQEQTRTLQYRLRKQDGAVLTVSDTMTSRRREDGVMVGSSVLADVTALRHENENLRFLSETMPCGFLKYTCEKTPRVTYINDQMLRLLRFPEGPETDYDTLESYKQNIYMMIPPEERDRFSQYLERVCRQGGPLAGEMTVLRRDGTRGCLFGWVTKCVNDQGVEEFQSACMDITERHHLRRERERARYLKALTEVYDKIFAYDLADRTVTCLHSHSSPLFHWLENIPMQMEEATEKWIVGNVWDGDRERVRGFFRGFYERRFDDADTPPVIRYRALSSDGAYRTYAGLFLQMEPSVGLFCCRRAGDPEETESLRQENSSLKGINENMQKLVLDFTDGLAAFEVVGDLVTPLYASDNVCEFFGFTQEDWRSVMRRRTPIREFVAGSKVAYEDFAALLEQGEGEFSYFDLRRKRERRIKAICSRRSPGDGGSRYVMLYHMDDGGKPAADRPRVRIRTFGYFDVFVDEKPIAFRNEKSKELFALLVDRRGGFVSSEEAIGFLWEDETANSVTLARYRKVALRLKNILEEYGIPDIVESVNGKRRLATDRVVCDLYDYLSGQEGCAQLFKGSYLTNYSWGESTLAELLGNRLARDGIE